MHATRDAFIAAQDRSVCEHGRAWRDGDGEITSMEYVPFYRLCACCSKVRKVSEYDPGGPDSRRHGGDATHCSVCVHDELVLDDRSDQTLDAMIAERGWVPISFDDAKQLAEDEKLLGYAMAVRHPSTPPDRLFRNDRLAAHAIIDIRERNARQRASYAEQERTVPEYMERSIAEFTGATPQTHVLVSARSSILIDIAHERARAVQG